MPTRETARQRGKRLGRVQRRRIGEEFRLARVGVGLSLREVGRRVGLSHSAVARRERGEVETLSIDQIAVVAGVLGLELRVGLFPTGAPVRDAAHLALIERFRSRLAATIRFRTEVPMPIPGDLRCADGVIDRLSAAEAVVWSKPRDTRHHRALVKDEPGLRGEFPVAPRACLRALADGHDPGGDALLLL